MPDVYEQHDAAFANVDAYIICKDGNRVGTVAIKFPKDGAGRLYLYLHAIGLPMVRGYATGYGYDKRSAAFQDALSKIAADDRTEYDARPWVMCVAITDKMEANYGYDWTRWVELAGYTVMQAI